MKLERFVRTPVEFNNCEVGDQLILGSGFTATCQKISEDGKYAAFCLDQYLDDNVPHYKALNYMDEVYEKTDIFESVKDLIIPFKSGNALRLPYAEEFFGPIDWVVPSDKEQWPLMKDIKNRIAYRKGDYEWGWLANQHKESASAFALVILTGHSVYYYASGTLGVRPVFRLRLKAE